MRGSLGVFFGGLAVELIGNFFGTAERVQQATGFLWATSPAIGLGLACLAAFLLAPVAWRSFLSVARFFDATKPSNMFQADARMFEGIHFRWKNYENGFGDPEERLLLVNDALWLLEKHDIPHPEATDGDALWRLFLLFCRASSRVGNLEQAQGNLARARKNLEEVEVARLA